MAKLYYLTEELLDYQESQLRAKETNNDIKMPVYSDQHF